MCVWWGKEVANSLLTVIMLKIYNNLVYWETRNLLELTIALKYNTV